jgi:hypothetical protein
MTIQAEAAKLKTQAIFAVNIKLEEIFFDKD